MKMVNQVTTILMLGLPIGQVSNALYTILANVTSLAIWPTR